MGKLDDKIALITGSSSGIGKAVALAFAREGAHLVINYPNPSQEQNAMEVKNAIAALGRRVIAVQADVSQEEQVRALVAETMRIYGRIDILVNNAGIATVSTVGTMPVTMWDEMIATNLRSVFLCTHFVLPIMYQQNAGKIINTASQLAYKGAPGLSHYCAAKAAIIAFTRSLSLEIGARNINANCVAPGATETPILSGMSKEALEAIRASIPKGRFATVDDIAPTYVFLASDEARHFVGQCLSPNGGDVML
ncbi:MAG TPA: SDR family NAD(P)-dependent oxidoreductase [Methylomirabilota bacterium]|nr:SDR family NAD(P)-dependent oxidoreductase [Methylomirabilota bacterium]